MGVCVRRRTPRPSNAAARLVDDVKVPDVQVDPRLLAELARGPHDREARLHRALAACARGAGRVGSVRQLRAEEGARTRADDPARVCAQQARAQLVARAISLLCVCVRDALLR